MALNAKEWPTMEELEGLVVLTRALHPLCMY